MAVKYSDERNNIPLNLFWLGILIYITSYLVSQTDKVSFILCNVFQVIGLVLFVPSAILLIYSKIENKYLASLYIVFMIWSTGVVLRGFSFDYATIKGMLFRPASGLFLYLVPLVLLFPRGPVFFKKVFDIIVIAGVLFLVFCMVFIKDLLVTYNEGRSQSLTEFFTQHLSIPCGYLLFTFTYHAGKRRWFALFVIVLSFLLAVIRARRGLMFITFSIMLISYIFYQYVNKTRVINILLSVFILILISATAVKIYNDNRKGAFSLITERIGRQTRSEVEQYFYRDLKSVDWIIGKGMNGKYFCPGVQEDLGRLSIYRSVIETGYLQIILNGGIMSLGLLLLIIIPAVVKGLFYSRNLLSKAAAAWIIVFLLYIYPGTPTIFSLNYILVWISIGVCYSSEIRKTPESELLEVFKPVDKPGNGNHRI